MLVLFFYADVSWLFTYKPLMKCQDWPAAFGLTATQPWSREKKALMAQKVGVLHMKRGEILAASWSGKKRKRQYQHKDLHCPKRKICLLLFWWSSWRWSVSSTAQTTMQDRCEESCINLAQDKVYERMRSRELKTTLSAKLKQPSPHCWLLFCLLVSHF